MNKNIIVVGAMAVGLYLLSQANKPQRAIVKKKAIYNKPKIKKAVARKKIAITSTKPQKKKSKIKYHIAV